MNISNQNFGSPQEPNNNSGFLAKNYFVTPAVNIMDSAGAFYIDLAAPGLQQEDFKLRLAQNVLTVSVEKNANPKQDRTGYLRREFGFGNFKRHFQLPITTNLDAIQATYENGILHLHIPKAPEKRLLHFSTN